MVRMLIKEKMTMSFTPPWLSVAAIVGRGDEPLAMVVDKTSEDVTLSDAVMTRSTDASILWRSIPQRRGCDVQFTKK